MPVGMLGYINYCVLFVSLSAGFLVTDISGAGWCRAMKFYRMVDLGGYQVVSPFGELCPRALQAKKWKIDNARPVWQTSHRWRWRRSACGVTPVWITGVLVLFSVALTIRPCIISSLEPAVPGCICTSARIVHQCTYKGLMHWRSYHAWADDENIVVIVHTAANFTFIVNRCSVVSYVASASVASNRDQLHQSSLRQSAHRPGHRYAVHVLKYKVCRESASV